MMSGSKRIFSSCRSSSRTKNSKRNGNGGLSETRRVNEIAPRRRLPPAATPQGKAEEREARMEVVQRSFFLMDPAVSRASGLPLFSQLQLLDPEDALR